MNKKSVSRVDHEAGEGLHTIKNEVPENKLQTTQQVADTDAALETKPAQSSFTAKKSKVKGATLKQQAIADMITGSAGSAGMGISAAGRGVSGTSGGILGANNSTPVAGKSRSDSRVGKKLDRLATKLNYTPTEQVVVEFDESKPLADASGEDQGYNGTYRNETARSQKIMGAVPGDLMFQRSVDLITKDKLYFVEGQQVFQVSGDRTGLNPSKSYYGMSEHDVAYTSGNFLHRALHFGLDAKGKVSYFYADVDDLTPSSVVDSEIANVSSAHRLIKSNVAEIDRQVMDSKAGDEKADIWSPLGRAVHQPTATAYLMSSIEADTGAYVYLAYSKATTNMSYQLNRGPKDGLDEVSPAIEECVGWRSTATDSDTLASSYSNSLSNVFDSDYYDLGDPALMIEAYDSTGKYKNKADLLLQPRGFRMHLQTADNNMNPFKVPSEFASVFTGQEVFSTIDHEYDPILPICMTDKANLITVHNLNELCGFVRVHEFKFTYSSSNIEATYVADQRVVIPGNAIGGLGYDNLYILYKKNKGDGLVYSNGVISMDPDSANLSDAVIEVIVSTTSSVTGYTLLATISKSLGKDVVIKLPTVQNADSTVITSVVIEESERKIHVDGAGPFSYYYSDLRNSYVVDVQHPLIDGIIEYINNSVGAKFRALLGSKHELLVPMVFSTQHMTLAQLLICAATPWIARVRMNAMKDIIYYEDNCGAYPFSKLESLKNVPFHNYVNFSFSGYDEPLGTKIMNPVVAIQWIMPEFFWKVASSKFVLPWYFNENEFASVSDGLIHQDASAISFPSIRSGIRLGALDTLYGMSEKDVRLSLDRLTKYLLVPKSDHISQIKAYKYGRNTDGQPYVEFSDSDTITMFDVLSCPRELGLCMDAPAGLFGFTDGSPNALTAEHASSFNIKIWVNKQTSVDPSILSAGGVNISRAANFVQKWISLAAATQTTDTVLAGLVFGMNDEGAAEFKPYAAFGTGAQYTSGPAIISLQRSLWTRIQLLPFVISPFDGHATSGASVRDIYDFAYMFGLCGFRASDYRESVYNREKEAVNQGLLFVDDPWVIDSPIVKNGASSAGISDAKGYEIKRA
jgi:hypothetical protein